MVGDEEAGLRLDKFLASDGRLGSRGRAVDALGRGKIFVNESEAGPADGARRLGVGDTIAVWVDRPGSASRRALRPPRSGELAIVYEDDAMVVVNKPPGLLTVPLRRRSDAASVERALGEHLRTRRRRPQVVHRIDRDTSGLVVFATNRAAQAGLEEQFRGHEAERIYLAVVHGVPTPSAGTWRDCLVWDEQALVQREARSRDSRAMEAVCHYQVVEAFRRSSLVQVSLVTGFRNQIRLQAALRGHALIGERQYPSGPETIPVVDFPRQALHAWRLAFRHPVLESALRFEVSMPPDMDELVRALRRNS